MSTNASATGAQPTSNEIPSDRTVDVGGVVVGEVSVEAVVVHADAASTMLAANALTKRRV
jgi:hypothetical protein